MSSSTSASDWLLSSLADFAVYVSLVDRISTHRGLLQAIDARIKIIIAVMLIVAVVFSARISAIALTFFIAAVLGVVSGVGLKVMSRIIWIPVVTFTGVIAAPALITTPGTRIMELPLSSLRITAQGLNTALLLIGRAETSATLSALLALTTPWSVLLKALRSLRVPIVFVVILSTTYRYLFLLLQTASEMADSRRSRSVGKLDPRERRRIASATVGVLLNKTFTLSNDVHMAMLSRGFRGEFHHLDEFQVRDADWISLGVGVSLAALVMWLGR